MMGGYGGSWGIGMGFGWIVPLVLIGLVIWGIVTVTRSRAGGTSLAAPDRSLAILKERYAKGELDSEAYQRMRAELER